MKKINICFLLFGLSWSVFSQETHKGKLVWEDDFNREDIFSTEIWTKIPRDTPDWANTMSDDDSLFEIQDGTLILSGKKNPDQDQDPAPHLTAGVFTKGKFYFHLGRIEVRCKLEAHQGAWPAIWLLPEGCPWPVCGEIDIMERLNYDHFVYQTVHTNYTQEHKETHKNHTTFPINIEDYNVYAVEITPDEVRFFVNDTLTFSYKREGDNPYQFPFDRPYYLLIDMQLGGKWVGDVAELEQPLKMHIDWVRYYQPSK